MLFRFSLYGFLKNLRFFDAFLLLALLDRGFDYLAIGTLLSVRELTVLLLEVPSGALADTFGRRRCMVLSMLGYIASGLVLWRADAFWLHAVAMWCFGAGDAFRSGTHKALILAWLRQQGRLGEKTCVYGYTRSWSQLGSAVSALAGGALLLFGSGYRGMFLASAAIAFANLVNLATYPAALDEEPDGRPRSIGSVYRRLLASLRDVVARGEVRTVMFAGVAVRGTYKAMKDYLQPVLQAIVVALPIATDWQPPQRVGVLVGVVSALLFVLNSVASRQAHRYEQLFADTGRCARALTAKLAAAMLLVGVAAWFDVPWLAVALFALLAIGNNLWRPVQVGRLGAIGDGERTATVLSIESQLGAFAAALLAPGVGALVDLLARGADPTPLRALAPLSLLAVPLALVAFAGAPLPRSSDRG